MTTRSGIRNAIASAVFGALAAMFPVVLLTLGTRVWQFVFLGSFSAPDWQDLVSALAAMGGCGFIGGAILSLKFTVQIR